MSERKRLQEDLFHRQLWSGPGRFPALQWCPQSGTLAFMTQTTVQIHSYQFQYMASFRAAWLSVEKGAPASGIAAYTPGEGSLSSLTDWFNRNSTKESVDIQCIAWCSFLRESISNHPLLTVLLTDGTLMLVDTVNGRRADPETEEGRKGKSFHPVGGGFQVRLHGLSLALDCTAAWNSYLHSRGGAPGAADRLRCFAEHKIPVAEGPDVNLLVLASRDKVSLWRVNCSAGDQRLSMEHLSEFVVTFISGSDAITALVVCPGNGTGSGAPGGDGSSFVVAASSSAGDVHFVRFEYTVSAPPTGTMKVLGAEVRSVKVSESAIADLQLLWLSLSDSAGGGSNRSSNGNSGSSSAHRSADGAESGSAGWYLCALSGSTVRCLSRTVALSSADADRDLAAAARLHKSNIVSVASLPAVHNGLELAVRIATASTTGDMASWGGAAPDHSCSRLTWSQLATLPNRSAGYPILGLGTDGAGLMVAYLYKTPATQANTREVQLNNALRFPRCAVAWELSPFVAEDFAASARMVAEVFLHLVAISQTGGGQRPLCLTALPLALLRSLECEAVRQHYRAQIKDLKVFPVISKGRGSKGDTTPSASAGGSASAGAGAVKVEGFAAGDVTSDSEYNEDEDSDSEQSGSKLSASVTPSKGPLAKNRFATSKQKRVSNMSAVYERIEQMERPSKPEAVALSVPTLIDAAVMAVKCLAPVVGDAAGSNSVRRYADGRVLVDEDLCDAVEEALDLDEKIAALFSLPSPHDSSLLLGKEVVWRCLHLLLLACHRVRGVPAFDAEWEPFPATLRQLLHTVRCIRALQGFTAQTQGSTGAPASPVNRLCAQSAYFSSLVVQARAEATPDPTTAAALSQLVTAAHSRLARQTAGKTLAEMYGSEACAICGSAVAFHPHDDDSSDTPQWDSGAVKVVQGGNVLHGSCAGCGVKAERCCFSLLMVTTAAAGDNSGEGSWDRLVGCPVCDAVTTPALARIGGGNGERNSEGALLCPYCGVLTLPR